ncbi:MAG: hypothetical protein WC768_00060 [Patescibacteria group bacterium]
MEDLEDTLITLDRRGINRLLPHGWPWRFLRQARFCSGYNKSYPQLRKVTAVAVIPTFLVGINPFLARVFSLGHFPGKLIVPGCLFAEVIAQAVAVKFAYGANGRLPQLLRYSGECRQIVLPSTRLFVKVDVEYCGSQGCRASGKIYRCKPDGSEGELAAEGSIVGRWANQKEKEV